MISVRRFTLQGSIWRQVTPFMEQVVRWINDNVKTVGRPVKMPYSPSRGALIAEAAFRRTAAGVPVFAQEGTAEAAAVELVSLLPQSRYSAFLSEPITASELLGIQLIQMNLIHSCTGLVEPKFLFSIPGCGVVNSATGDIIDGTHLVEVKTVDRAFRSVDLRQVLTYCAMRYSACLETGRVSLLNPRRGLEFSSDLDALARSVSGRPAVALMQNLVDAMVGFQVST